MLVYCVIFPYLACSYVLGPISMLLTPAYPFLKRWSSSGVTPSQVRLHRHVCCADASRKRTSTVRARCKLPSPAWSGVSTWTCQVWVALPHSPKDHWHTIPCHDDNVETQSAGMFTICWRAFNSLHKWLSKMYSLSTHCVLTVCSTSILFTVHQAVHDHRYHIYVVKEDMMVVYVIKCQCF